ncbi:FkbM family methyltransferase [Halobellus sp. Atlit-38R]|nr:FkbM family methyltransferase [Halobellus sp. Atlit-38R]
MADKLTRVNRWATRLGVRPVAARLYWLMRRLYETAWGVRYKQHRLRSGTYRVTAQEAQAAFAIPTRREYLDFVKLPERPILEELLSDLQPDDVFYDLGANLGVYSCFAASVVAPTVVAFEPHPANADKLAQNVALNDADVSIQRVALASSSGTARMQLAPGFDADVAGSAGHTLLTDYYDEASETIQVEKRRGDEFVANEDVQPPTVLKIDTEGSEIEVLEGFDSTLARPECRLVYCELHEDRLNSRGHSVADVYDLLESHGFSVEDRTIEGYQTFVRGEK